MSKQNTKLIIIAFIAFISLGLPDGLLGVAWPGIRETFSLRLDAISLLLVCGTVGYTLSSFFSGFFVRKIGLGILLGLSCGATALTLIVYAATPVWWLFVLFSTVGGFGAGAIDAGINTYIAKYHSDRTMQWLHASFGIGITMGPFIMTAAVSLLSNWKIGYVVSGIAQGLLALLFLFTSGLWDRSRTAAVKEAGSRTPAITEGEKEGEKDNSESIGATLKVPTAWLSMLIFLIYTGVETGLGVWAYTLLTESRGVEPAIAGIVTGSYWGSFTVGRLLAGWYTSRISTRRIIYTSLFAALAGILMVVLRLGAWMTVAGIALTGFSIAPLFPGLVSDTVIRVGKKHQANTIGMQISAAGLGAALIPSLAGFMARTFGLEVIPLFLLADIILVLIIFRLSHIRKFRENPGSA